MIHPDALGRIGLARRAGKLAAGEENCLKALRTRKASLVILAADASDNTKKRFRDKCAHYKVPLIETGTRHELGAAVGRGMAAILAVTDPHLADGLLRTISNNGGAID